MNVQVVSDQKLLNCYLSGDRNAISQLIERHSRRVRDYIQMMCREPRILIPGEDKAKYLAAIKMQKDTPTPETFERFVGEELLSQLRKEVTPRK